MNNIHTQIEINASAKEVWNILIDFDKYGEWNPFIKSIHGNPVAGEKMQVFIQPPGSKGMNFTPRVISVDLNHEFRWHGHLIFPGLFDGEHIFLIESTGENKVKFTHAEQFKGLLVPLLAKALKNTQKGFELMNEALKKRAEKSVS